MKILSAILLLFSFLTVSGQQAVISTTGKAILFMEGGSTLALDGLVLRPVEKYGLGGIKYLERDTATGIPVTGRHIRRVYKFAHPLPAFTGDMLFFYNDDELNDIPENRLILNAYNQSWQIYPPGSTDPQNNFVLTPLRRFRATLITLADRKASLFLPVKPGTAAGLQNNDHRDMTGDKEQPLLLYPNPVADLLHISSRTLAIKKITVVNTGGNLVQGVMPGGALHYQLQVQQLPRGIYVLQVLLEDDSVVTDKFIKQ